MSGSWRRRALLPAPCRRCSRAAACAWPRRCMSVPGISRMYLAPADSWRVDADEREALRRRSTHEFGARRCCSCMQRAAGWLLEAPFAGRCERCRIPDSLGGAALAREPASASAAQSAASPGRRSGNVAGHHAREPHARASAALPPVNCIWFWGGGSGSREPRARQRSGSLIQQLASPMPGWPGSPALQVARCQQVRAAGTTCARQRRCAGDPAAAGSWVMLCAQLPAWESDWFAPAWRDLDARRLPALRLQIGSSAWQLPAPRLARWLRRARPWWQAGVAHELCRAPSHGTRGCRGRCAAACDDLPPLLRRIYAARHVTSGAELATGLDALLPVARWSGVQERPHCCCSMRRAHAHRRRFRCRWRHQHRADDACAARVGIPAASISWCRTAFALATG